MSSPAIQAMNHPGDRACLRDLLMSADAAWSAWARSDLCDGSGRLQPLDAAAGSSRCAAL